MALIAQQMNATVYYASPTGTDAEGTSNSAPGNLFEMTWKLEAGDELILLDGQYDLTKSWWINLKGTPTAPIIIRADENATPILDFRNQTSGLGVGLQGEYTHLKGITIRYAAHIGIWNFGSYNILECLDVYGNYDTGVQNRDGGHNMIINCDSHDNFDYKHLRDDGSLDYGGNADGFADKWGKEPYSSNVYIGCRAWNNSDDGFDFWERISGEKPTVVINCIAYNNGPATYDMTNHPRVALDKEWFDKCGETLSAYKNYGNGNGYKLGGMGTKHNVELYRCLAVGHRNNGFDQNDDAGNMKIINCMAYQNDYNYGFYRSDPFTLDIHNCISLEPTDHPNNHFWTGEPNNVTQSHNSWNDGFSVSASDFESLDVKNLIIAPRNADGSLPETKLFHLRSTALHLIDKGMDYPATNFKGDEIARYVDFNGTAPDLGCYEYTPTKVSYTLDVDEVFASGTTIDRDIITMTFGEAGGPDFRSSMINPIDDTFVSYTPGNGVNGDNKGGTFYYFSPQKDGQLTIGIRQNMNKKLFIEEDGIVMPNYNGIICSETEALSYTLSFFVKSGSLYKVYCTGSKLGFYGFTFNSRIIKANDITMAYGSDVPDLTYTVHCEDGDMSGTPTLTTTASKTSPIGTYPIKVEKGTITDDNLVYIDGTLTITKVPLTVSVQDVTISRGEAIPSFTLTYDGFRNNDTEETAFTKKPTVHTAALEKALPGVYEITVADGEAINYTINYQPGKLTILPVGENWRNVALKRQITHPQPMTGICLGPWTADVVNSTHGKSIQLEFNYFLPCRIVKGCKEDGTIIYDWSYFDEILNDVASRGHQLVARFRYEYPSADDVDGIPGSTAVPDYIKQLPDYHETYSESMVTYYADWSNAELQRFTLQFYTDFAKRYAHDPRLAFLEVGFGHWAEYHIYPTQREYGKNFPSLEYQKKFLLNMSKVSDGLPWLVSKNAADTSPIPNDEELLALRFGMFEDSFMREYVINGGYNECYRKLRTENRWQTGVIGGEMYCDDEEEINNYLNPKGQFGYTFEEMAQKYNLTFMIHDYAPYSSYGTPERIKQASMATGYRFVVKRCATDGKSTLLLVSNEGIAPIYRDAYFAIGNVRSETSLKGLLPNKEVWIEIAAKPHSDGEDIKIVSDYILPQQEIQFEVKIEGDANGDGLVNAADIVEVVNYVNGQPSNNFKFTTADLNKDGKVNLTDINMIANKILLGQ